MAVDEVRREIAVFPITNFACAYKFYFKAVFGSVVQLVVLHFVKVYNNVYIISGVSFISCKSIGISSLRSLPMVTLKILAMPNKFTKYYATCNTWYGGRN